MRTGPGSAVGTVWSRDEPIPVLAYDAWEVAHAGVLFQWYTATDPRQADPDVSKHPPTPPALLRATPPLAVDQRDVDWTLDALQLLRPAQRELHTVLTVDAEGGILAATWTAGKVEPMSTDL